MADIELQSIGADPPGAMAPVAEISEISEAGEAGVTSGTFVFRTLAKWQTSTFYGTLLLGFFITQFATKYTPENDIVYRVFDNWNPCIFFDHYPSTNFTMVGMTLFSFSSAAMTLFMLVHVLLTQPSFFTSMKHITWAGPMILMQMAFTNIFSANAYTDALGGYSNKPDYSGMNATTYAAATAGMTRDEIDGVSPDLWFAIMLHTCFFILFIVADIMLVVLTWQHVAVLKGTRFWPAAPTEGWAASSTWRSFVEWFVFIMYFIGIGFYAMRLIIFIFSHDGVNRFHWREAPSTLVQAFVSWGNSTFLPSKWFFLIITGTPWMFPDKIGINYKFTLADDQKSIAEGDINSGAWTTGHLQSPALISWGFKVLGLLVFFTYGFQSTDKFSSDRDFPLAKGFRGLPFNLFFAPLWCIITAACGTGMGLMTIKENLLNGRSCKFYALAISGSVFTASQLLCILTVIPTSPAPTAMAYTMILALPVWVLAAHGHDHARGLFPGSRGDTARLVTFLVLWLLGLIFSATRFNPGTGEGGHLGNFLLVALLVGYDKILPALGDGDLSLELTATTFDAEEAPAVAGAEEDVNEALNTRCCYSCCYSECFSNFGGYVMVVLAVYNMTKVPWYTVVPFPATNTTTGSPAFGMEGFVSLRAIMGIRGSQFKADPGLFLGPHTVMGALMLVIGATVVWRKVSIAAASVYLFPLSAVFALHALPVSDGIPGLPINILAIVLTVASASIGTLARRDSDEWLLERCFGMVIFCVISAPVLELFGIFKSIAAMAGNGGEWVVLAGQGDGKGSAELPHAMSGRCPYASMGLPLWIGPVISVLLVIATAATVGAHWNKHGNVLFCNSPDDTEAAKDNRLSGQHDEFVDAEAERASV